MTTPEALRRQHGGLVSMPDVYGALSWHEPGCCCTACMVRRQRAAYAAAHQPPEHLVRLVRHHRTYPIYRSACGPAFGFVWQRAFMSAFPPAFPSAWGLDNGARRVSPQPVRYA